MDHSLLVSLFMLTSICMAMTAKADDMTVSTRDVGYEYLMTTNPVVAVTGESMKINLDLQGCYPD
jgi:hypothetical protein